MSKIPPSVIQTAYIAVTCIAGAALMAVAALLMFYWPE